MTFLTALKHAIEGEYVETLLELYDDDVTLTIIDHTRPPSNPLVLKGRPAVEMMLRDIYARDMEHKVEKEIEDKHDGRASFIEHCVYRDNGAKVISANLIHRNSRGKINEHTIIQAF